MELISFVQVWDPRTGQSLGRRILRWFTSGNPWKVWVGVVKQELLFYKKVSNIYKIQVQYQVQIFYSHWITLATSNDNSEKSLRPNEKENIWSRNSFEFQDIVRIGFPWWDLCISCSNLVLCLVYGPVANVVLDMERIVELRSKIGLTVIFWLYSTDSSNWKQNNYRKYRKVFQISAQNINFLTKKWLNWRKLLKSIKKFL